MTGLSVTRAGSARSLVLAAAAMAFSLGLAGCGTVDNMLFGGEETGAPQAQTESQPGTMPGTFPGSAPAAPVSSSSAGGQMYAPQAPAAAITPVTIEPGGNTGTAVSQTIASLRNELSAMQHKIVAAATRLDDLKQTATQLAGNYHQTKAQITTRLQVGTTRGNPELVSAWNSAQNSLDSLTANINQMNALGTQIADIASRAHYILNTVQGTYNVSGAVDEDHRQLSVLEDETNQTIVLIDRLLKDVSGDIQRQTAYVANERSNLTTLAASIKNGELYGGTLTAGAAPASYGPAESGSPLVTIRFDHPHVEYQQILYTALSQALQSRPDATFSIVAVSPTRGTLAAVQLAQTAAQRHAQEVLRSMTDMGVPGTRLSISSSTDPTITSSEVRVYVR